MKKTARSDCPPTGAGAAYLGSVLDLIASSGPAVFEVQTLLDAHPIDAREPLDGGTAR